MRYHQCNSKLIAGQQTLEHAFLQGLTFQKELEHLSPHLEQQP